MLKYTSTQTEILNYIKLLNFIKEDGKEHYRKYIDDNNYIIVMLDGSSLEIGYLRNFAYFKQLLKYYFGNNAIDFLNTFNNEVRIKKIDKLL
jgi:hypothetical protein